MIIVAKNMTRKSDWPGLQSEKWRWSGLIDLAEGSGILALGAFQPLKLAQRVAIKRYREFVEKGIKQGTREDLQGGDLVRSAGGETAGLLGRSNEEREKGTRGFWGVVILLCRLWIEPMRSLREALMRRFL